MSNVHGSSAIASNCVAEFAKVVRPNGSEAFMIGLNAPYGRNVDTPMGQQMASHGVRIDNWNYGTFWLPKSRRGMGLCFGVTGSGKNGLIVPAGINYDGNMVFNDTKAELAWLLANRRRQLKPTGKVAICDPLGEVNRAYGAKAGVTETVIRYNPLAELDPESIDFAEDIAAIRQGIALTPSSGKGDDFFAGAGADLIDGVIAAEVIQSPPGRATLRNVRRWLTYDDPSFAAAIKTFCDDHPDTLAASKLRQFVDNNRTNQGIKATAKQQTNFLDSEPLLRYMEPEPGEPTFSFRELTGDSLLDVFICLPATHLVSLNRWVRLMMNQAMRAVVRSRDIRSGWPVVFMLDEAGTSLGYLPEVETAYGLNAGLGILCWSFYQDLNQLMRDYPKSWETFIANSTQIQILAARDKTTCDYFSAFLGQRTVTTTSDSVSNSNSTGSRPGYGSSTSGSSYSTSETGVPVCPSRRSPQHARRTHDRDRRNIFSLLAVQNPVFRGCPFQWPVPSRSALCEPAARPRWLPGRLPLCRFSLPVGMIR